MRTDKKDPSRAKDMRWILIALTALGLDQLIKAVVLTNATPGGLITIAYNTGITLGFLRGANTAMILISVFALAALTYLALRSQGRERVLYGLISGGVAGNLIDRVVRQGVVDYLSIGTFPVFNLADTFIVCGVAGLVALELFQNSSNSSRSSR